MDPNLRREPHTKGNLQERTKQFALRIIRLYLGLPNRGLT
jgi:hypothetical protein